MELIKTMPMQSRMRENNQAETRVTVTTTTLKKTTTNVMVSRKAVDLMESIRVGSIPPIFSSEDDEVAVKAAFLLVKQEESMRRNKRKLMMLWSSMGLLAGLVVGYILFT